MTAIQNFLQFLYDNWTAILVCIGIIIGIAEKTISYFSKSEDEKVEIAKTQIQQTMLKMITEAEITYETWNKSGSIKRSQVIEQIFEKYPILSKVTNQDEIIDWIDTEINNSLKTLREIVAINNETAEEEETTTE